MRVSIILTCYKQASFIEESILSIINQTYNNWELLIGDDSPDNNCRNIIEKYVKRYPDKIQAYHHTSNKGIVNNILFLLEHRNKESEYIAFLEGDDCLFPEYLHKKLEIFNKYSNIQLVYNELNTIDKNSKIIERYFLKKYSKEFYKRGKLDYDKLISETIYASYSTLMIRTDMINKYKISPSFLGNTTIISDIYFFNQIAHNEDIFGIEEPLVYWRTHSNSTSKHIDGWLKMNYEMIEYYKYLLKRQFITKQIFNKLALKRYLTISIMSLKKAFSISVITTIKYFIAQCLSAIKFRLGKIF